MLPDFARFCQIFPDFAGFAAASQTLCEHDFSRFSGCAHFRCTLPRHVESVAEDPLIKTKYPWQAVASQLHSWKISTCNAPNAPEHSGIRDAYKKLRRRNVFLVFCKRG